MLGKFVVGFLMLCLLSLGMTFISMFLSATLMYIIEQFKQFEQFKEFKKEKKTVGLTAWKVEPELTDRFLNLLADNDYKWFSGPKANELKNWDDDDVVLIIEIPPKRIAFMRYSSHPTKSQESLNIIEITEELLKHMENEGIVRMRGEGTWKH